jgi:hypothetical protein
MGIGNTPFGAGPYGFGSTPTPPSPDGQVYYDAALGRTMTGRHIDPKTRQYVFDVAGRVAGQDTVPQRVGLAYMTARDSSALRDFGERLSLVEQAGDGFEREIEALAREPVQSLIDQKFMRIDRVVVEKLGNGSFLEITWTDLTTGREHKETR